MSSELLNHPVRQRDGVRDAVLGQGSWHMNASQSCMLHRATAGCAPKWLSATNAAVPGRRVPAGLTLTRRDDVEPLDK
jgi:hypothetical protein